MKLRIASLAIVLVALVAIPALAQNDVYDNGPTNGTVDAWTINFGFAVSDTFTLGASTPVNGVNFAAWLFPGDVLESAEVSITSSEFGGTTYFDGTVNFTQSGCTTNQLGLQPLQRDWQLRFDEPERRHLLAEPAERGRQHWRSDLLG